MAKKISKNDRLKFKNSAYEYIVVQGETQKRTAELLDIPEQTVSTWAAAGKWRELRRSRQSAIETARQNLRNIISLLSEQRLRIKHDIQLAQSVSDRETELNLRRQASSISDDISKNNRALRDIEKENKITLGTIIDVMDDIFNNLRIANLKIVCPHCKMEIDLYGEMLEFQAMYIRQKTLEL